MTGVLEDSTLNPQRQKKLQQIRDMNVDPYPRNFNYTHSVPNLVSEFQAKSGDELKEQSIKVRTCGRIVALRGFGKAAFATLSEGGVRIQFYIKKDQVPAEIFSLFKLVDVGDFVGVEGGLFRTKTGELTVMVADLEFLSKGLLPLPEKWHGLADIELRYRQRYLDLIVNPEVRRTFIVRSRIIQEIRGFMDEKGYIEVETPMMQPIAGGATARPFKTYHNALGMDFYLRIAPELYLKRLIIGGLERVYEINRNFRNEGLSTQHNPEFTMLEFYQAYSDYRELMDLTEEMLTRVVERVTGSRELEYMGRHISFDDWQRLTVKQAIIKYWDPSKGHTPSPDDLSSSEKLLRYLKLYGMGENVDFPVGLLQFMLFEAVAEEHLTQPTFIYDFPVEVSPLSKTKPDDDTTVERFELFIGGLELANAYSELNDPEEQHRRFESQVSNRQKGDDEAHAMDEDYIRALGYGMPPTAGEGIGIDRLVMLLTHSKSIRDVILFPHLRPEHGRRSIETNL